MSIKDCMFQTGKKGMCDILKNQPNQTSWLKMYKTVCVCVCVCVRREKEFEVIAGMSGDVKMDN